ncbi:MAG: hypothetical protein QME78_11230 [Thermodesulfobacteriota bacterium]|nr:hypothetical protein [Thermodesulfobacteriota bacterium]
MNFESLLGGGGSGLLVAIATFFGLHKRLDSHKETLKILQNTKVDTKFCDEKHKMVENIYEEVKYIRARVDDLINSRKM